MSNHTPLWRELRTIIEDRIHQAPRTLQATIGPSEIGTPCDRCLIHNLAGTPEQEIGTPWLPHIGTLVHEWLAEVVTLADLPGHTWLAEEKVTCGTIGGQPLTGTADLFHLPSGTVWDWKVVGSTTMRAARRGPTDIYRRQVHTYGAGMENAGHQVNHVAIGYLPRNARNLGEAVIWSEPYDRSIAEAAIARADMFAAAITQMGPTAVLEMAPAHTGTEFSCPKYPDGATAPSAPKDQQLAGLITPAA